MKIAIHARSADEMRRLGDALDFLGDKVTETMEGDGCPESKSCIAAAYTALADLVTAIGFASPCDEVPKPTPALDEVSMPVSICEPGRAPVKQTIKKKPAPRKPRFKVAR